MTPRQGTESLRDWPVFRLSHLREDGDTAVHAATPAATGDGTGHCSNAR